jgi:hypothetical protein
MVIVGIDMSKNSPGVCVRREFSLEFISFLRGKDSGKFSKRDEDHFNLLTQNGVKIHHYNYSQPSNMEYSESETWKAEDASRYAQWIVSHLPEDVDFVGIEGFSYGSAGNSFIDVVGYGYAVRMAILNKYGKEKFSVFSPGNVKKMAGKGNANKEAVMQFFLESKKEDLAQNQFWKKLTDGSIDKSKKPVDDLIDSYFVQECAAKFYSEKLGV